MTECPFCRIVAGDIPAAVVYRDDSVLAFRDISPQAPVHVLVIPRRHYADIAEVAAADPGLVGAMVARAAAVAADLTPAGAGHRLIFNTGADAGQTVFHAHLHLLAGATLGRAML